MTADRKHGMQADPRPPGERTAAEASLATRRSEALANLSHELKTPLTLILGPTERLVRDPHLSDEARRDLQVVQRNAWMLLRHVEDLLELAREDVGATEIRYTETDLASLVRLSGEHFEALAAERRMRFEVDTPPTLPAQVDVDKVERILLNLLFNAFKHTRAGGTIRCTLTTDPSGSRGAVAVSDDGPGVPPELREAVFEPYHTGREGQGGVGLGLSIVRQFTRLHGGAVTLGESPEGGALFTVSLPLRAPSTAQPVAKAGGLGPWGPRLAQLAQHELRGRREQSAPEARPALLVVAREGEARSVLTACLEGTYPVTVATPEEARARIRSERPDAVISEAPAADQPTDAFVTELREGDPDRVLVIHTPEADPSRRLALLRLGVDEVLEGPVPAEEIQARVANLVARKRSLDRLRGQVAGQREDLAVLARDVTRRQWELRTALEETQVARDLAQRASRIKSNFLRMMSHELRTPVTAMQLQLTLLERDREEPLGPRQAGLVERLNRSSRRLLDLIESALEYARVESGRYRARPTSIALAPLLEEVAREFGSFSDHKGLALVTQADPVPPLVSDPQLVRLVTINLVGNALKHTETGQVVLSARHDGEVHWLEVTDTGPGMTPEVLEELFDPFRQSVDLRSRQGPGSGLGLTIVNELVRALGGEISVRSKPGEGSTFSVRLPELEASPPTDDGE